MRTLWKISHAGTGRILNVIVRAFAASGTYFSSPKHGPLLKKIAGLAPAQKSQSYVFNLSTDVCDTSSDEILPLEMLKRLVRESGYRAVMDSCLCRSAFDCSGFSHEQGCLYLGPGAKGVVKRALGREISEEEALAHIDKASQMGLIGQVMWLEAERHILGAKREKGAASWLKICFCCPCCCSIFKLMKNARQDMGRRVRSIGWKARVDKDACIACGLCVLKCPVQALDRTSQGIVVDDEICLGCGFCASLCPKQALKLHLTEPLRDNVQDYFVADGLKVEI